MWAITIKSEDAAEQTVGQQLLISPSSHSNKLFL